MAKAPIVDIRILQLKMDKGIIKGCMEVTRDEVTWERILIQETRDPIPAERRNKLDAAPVQP